MLWGCPTRGLQGVGMPGHRVLRAFKIFLFKVLWDFLSAEVWPQPSRPALKKTHPTRSHGLREKDVIGLTRAQTPCCLRSNIVHMRSIRISPYRSALLYTRLSTFLGLRALGYSFWV